uniref:Uncharacterized protein n=1 Tax=Arundo donax TaxID=35708 RepID=A0A0A9FQL8_ARUDO
MSALKLSNYFSQWGMFSLPWCLCFRMKQQCALRMLQYKHRSTDLSMCL